MVINIKNFPKVFEIIKKENPDIICMSRFIPGKYGKRSFCKNNYNRIVNFILNLLEICQTSDATNGFEYFQRKLS